MYIIYIQKKQLAQARAHVWYVLLHVYVYLYVYIEPPKCLSSAI
jgi:hypothetical protein